MSVDAVLIDQIVAGVLGQLGRSEAGAPAVITTETRRHGAGDEAELPVELNDRIITAEVLQAAVNRARAVLVQAKAIVTPAARDVARELGVEIRRAGKHHGSASTGSASGTQQTTLNSQLSTLNSSPTHHSPLTTHLLIVVRNTPAVDRLWEQLGGSWRRELVGCPDDAAKLAIGEISRGGAAAVVILSEQTHRAVCLANRSDQVKAAAVRDVQDVRTVRQQLRANVWCLDPTGKSWFELKRLFDSLSSSS